MSLTTALREAPAIAVTVAPISPRILSIPNACAYSATGRSKLYEAHRSGDLEFIKIDGSTRVEVSELDRWIDAKINQAA